MKFKLTVTLQPIKYFGFVGNYKIQIIRNVSKLDHYFNTETSYYIKMARARFTGHSNRKFGNGIFVHFGGNVSIKTYN